MPNLLEAIKARGSKSTEFSYGILTADRYVRTVLDCAGVDACYKYAATRDKSFNDVLKQAANTLVYSNKDMMVEDIYSETNKFGFELELPKNTLMVFKHILTTPRKDRDGDILRTQGAQVDPKMLLLWQHIPTLPIGKMLKTVEHNSEVLRNVSAIIDMNDLSHDAAVMVDNKMGRFSHGFSAIDYELLDDKDPVSGFDIKAFEIMEESLVSVPSNADAETEEVLLSLVEGGKLTSAIMKETGKTIRASRDLQVPGVEIKYSEKLGNYNRELKCNSFGDLLEAHKVGLIGDKNENKSGSGSGKKQEKEGCACPSKETDGQESQTKKTDHTEVIVDVKSGRTISKANETKIKDAKDSIQEVLGMEELPKAGKALLREASAGLDEVLAGLNEEEFRAAELDVKQHMAKFIELASTEDIAQMQAVLKAMQGVDQKIKQAEEFNVLLST